MSYSLGEIEALCRKAAKGAGYGWGMAEEAGRAARWLEAQGLPGADCLLTCLEDDQADRAAPLIVGQDWHSPAQSLCPIVTGACLSDHAAQIASHAIQLDTLRHPLLLAPFVASAAALQNITLHLTWSDVRLVISGNSHRIEGSQTNLHAAIAQGVTCGPGTSDATPVSLRSRADLAPDTYQRLCALAQRTYAPATEASRIAGAGSGLSDND